MAFPGKPQPWHDSISNEEVKAVALQIAERVAALKTRRVDLGDAQAFDPMNDDTNKAFGKLWEAAFAPNYNPKDQERIMTRLRLFHEGTVEDMREIGRVSERHLELGHADRAIQLADAMKETPLVEEWRQVQATGLANAQRYEAAVERGDVEEAAAAHREQDKLMPRYDALIDKRSQLLDQLTASFPYHTYELLGATEATLLTGLKGLTPQRMQDESHLFVEAGALPLTPINHVMTRRFSHVVCTVGDEESFFAARAFVKELERLGVLEEGHVFVLPLSVDDPEFAHVLRGNKRGFHSATISQLVQGRDEVERIAAVLADKNPEKGCGIDTVIARGADGMVELLYEPMNNLILPNGVRKRFTNKPVHAVPSVTSEDSAAIDFHHTYPCYNTSHVYSARQRIPGFHPGDDIALFRGQAIDNSPAVRR